MENSTSLDRRQALRTLGVAVAAAATTLAATAHAAPPAKATPKPKSKGPCSPKSPENCAERIKLPAALDKLDKGKFEVSAQPPPPSAHIVCEVGGRYYADEKNPTNSKTVVYQ